MDEVEALIDRFIRIKLRGIFCRHQEEEANRILDELEGSGAWDSRFRDAAREWQGKGMMERLQLDKCEADLFASWFEESVRVAHGDERILDGKTLEEMAVVWPYQWNYMMNSLRKEYMYALCREGRCMEFLERNQ